VVLRLKEISKYIKESYCRMAQKVRWCGSSSVSWSSYMVIRNP